MEELFDIYDINKRKTGKVGDRYSYVFKEGEYHIVTDVFIFNSKNELLLTRRVPTKKGGLLWEGTGGSVLAGEESKDAIIREVKEELGLTIRKEELVLLKELRRDEKISPRFKDLWTIRKDFDISDLKLQAEEVMDAKWVDLEEFKKMVNNGEVVETIDFDEDDYNKAIALLNK